MAHIFRRGFWNFLVGTNIDDRLYSRLEFITEFSTGEKCTIDFGLTLNTRVGIDGNISYEPDKATFDARFGTWLTLGPFDTAEVSRTSTQLVARQTATFAPGLPTVTQTWNLSRQRETLEWIGELLALLDTVDLDDLDLDNRTDLYVDAQTNNPAWGLAVWGVDAFGDPRQQIPNLSPEIDNTVVGGRLIDLHGAFTACYFPASANILIVGSRSAPHIGAATNQMEVNWSDGSAPSFGLQGVINFSLLPDDQVYPVFWGQVVQEMIASKVKVKMVGPICKMFATYNPDSSHSPTLIDTVFSFASFQTVAGYATTQSGTQTFKVECPAQSETDFLPTRRNQYWQGLAFGPRAAEFIPPTMPADLWGGQNALDRCGVP